MITITNKVQLSVDANGRPIFVVAGENPAEFEQNVNTLFGAEAFTRILEWADGRITGLAVTPDQAVANVNAAMNSAPAAAAPAAPAQDGAPPFEVDKWGAKWTYNMPGAPAGPNGTKVLKEAISKAGKPYKAWMCPTHSPHAYRNGIAKDTSQEPEFLR